MKAHRFSFFAVLALTACQSTAPSPYNAPEVAQPPISTFHCDGGQTLTVRNYGASVNVTTGDGKSSDLPAVGNNSKSRFSLEQTAIVFDGTTALYMVTGKPPLDCRR